MARIVFGLGAAFLVLGAGQASAACSNASLKGTYGVQITGQTSSKMQVASLYLIKADGVGKITGSGVQNQGGSVTSVPVTATYKVTPACTGTVHTSGGDTLDFVLDGSNANLQIIQAGNGDGVAAGAGFLQGTVPCNPSGLNGTFGGSGIVGTTATSKPVSFVGQTTYDGKGGATGAGVLNASGTILTTKATATYTVSPACFITATVKTTVSFGASVVATSTTHNAGLLVKDGSQLLTISTDPGSVNSGRGQK